MANPMSLQPHITLLEHPHRCPHQHHYQQQQHPHHHNHPPHRPLHHHSRLPRHRTPMFPLVIQRQAQAQAQAQLVQWI